MTEKYMSDEEIETYLKENVRPPARGWRGDTYVGVAMNSAAKGEVVQVRMQTQASDDQDERVIEVAADMEREKHSEGWDECRENDGSYMDPYPGGAVFAPEIFDPPLLSTWLD